MKLQQEKDQVNLETKTAIEKGRKNTMGKVYLRW